MLYLKINLIFIPPFFPHLNPIEQIWRKMKREIKHFYLESKEFLHELTINMCKESILDTKYMPKVGN